MKEKNVNFLKGKKNAAALNRINFFINFIVLVLLAVRLSSFGAVSSSDFHLNSQNISIAKLLENYYAFPIVKGADPINADNQLRYNELLDIFYEETKEIYRPVLMDCNNYVSFAGEQTLAQQYNQLWVTVNEYYLEVNPIHDLDGIVIEPSIFQKGALNILIPDTMELSEVIDSQFSYYKSQGYAFNGIYYPAGETIRAFSPFAGKNGNGLIENPVIIIYDSELIWGQMLNYVSGEHIYFQLKSENPYEEIYPSLKEYQLDGILLKAEPIANVYDNSISFVNKELRTVVWELIILIALFVFTMYNGCSSYVRQNERKLAVKNRFGYGAWDLNMPLMLSITVQYGILLLLSPILHYHILLLAGMFAVHLGLETVCFYLMISKGAGR